MPTHRLGLQSFRGPKGWGLRIEPRLPQPHGLLVGREHGGLHLEVAAVRDLGGEGGVHHHRIAAALERLDGRHEDLAGEDGAGAVLAQLLQHRLGPGLEARDGLHRLGLGSRPDAAIEGELEPQLRGIEAVVEEAGHGRHLLELLEQGLEFGAGGGDGHQRPPYPYLATSRSRRLRASSVTASGAVKRAAFRDSPQTQERGELASWGTTFRSRRWALSTLACMTSSTEAASTPSSSSRQAS